MRGRRWIGLLAVPVAAVALTASACGSSGGAPRVTHVSMAAEQINAQPRGALKQGGTVTWPEDEFTNQWNTYQVDGTEGDETDIIDGVMPMIFHFTAAGVPYPDTDYLRSATRSTVNGKQVVTYDLNPVARWSNGTPITWQDFYWVWKADNGQNQSYDINTSTGYSQISNVAQGNSPSQVVVTFATPFTDWQSLFWPLFPASSFQNPKSFNTGWINQIPITAGPFEVQSINQTAKTVTIVRNPHWWGTAPLLDRIVFPTLTDDAMASAFANGEIDWMGITNVSDYKRVKSVPNTRIDSSGGPYERVIQLNGDSPPFTDIRVRQAFSEAIDRAAVTRADLSGLPWPDQTVGNHIFLNDQRGYQDNSNPVGTYSVASADKLLTQAGWTMNKDGYRYKNGKVLTATFMVIAGLQTDVNEFDLVQQMEKAVGFKLTMVTVPGDQIFAKYLPDGQFDAVVYTNEGNAFPVSVSESSYQNPQGSDIFENTARIGSPRVDALFRQALSASSTSQEDAIANQIDKQLWTLVNGIPLYMRPVIVATRADLANFGASGLADINYENIGFMKHPTGGSGTH